MAKITKLEIAVIALLITSFFVGLTYGFPSTTVTADEMYFVGGVFRAMDNHTIVPQGTDVPYGTINYLLSYTVIAVILLIALPFFGGQTGVLKIWVINHYYLFYLVPRLINITAAVLLLFFIYRLLKETTASIPLRLAILIILFTNLMTACILRTGKVWPLSTFFVFASFYFLYRTLTGKRKSAFKAVIFSGLAAANFPLAALSLVAWPILFIYYSRQGLPKRELWRYFIWGIAIILIILAFNYRGIIDQVRSIIFDYTLTPGRLAHNIPILPSFGLNAVKIFLLFAPILLAMLVLIKGVRDKRLFYLALGYLLSFYFVISVVARWSNDIYSGLRYLFPIGFFLVAVLAGCKWREGLLARLSIYVLAGVSAAYLILALVYLSSPLTANKASDWVSAHLNRPGVTIINPLGPLFELPLNKNTALLIKDDFCASRCQAARSGELQTNFLPTVIGEHSKSVNILSAETYYVFDQATTSPRLTLSYSLANPLHYNWLHEIDTLGDYFDPTFFALRELGDNIYIYRSL